MKIIKTKLWNKMKDKFLVNKFILKKK